MFSHLFNVYFSNVRYSFRHPVVKTGGFVFLFSLVVLSLVIVLVWLPPKTEYSETEQTVNQIKNEIIVLNQLAGISPGYDAMSETLIKIDQKLKSSTSLAEFTRKLYSLADKYKVKLVSKTSRDGQVKDGYKVLYQELTLQGRYESIRQFISSLRDMPSWTLIKDARLKRKKSNNELIGDFVLVSYTKHTGI